MRPLDNIRVLVVEDHTDLAETIVDFLETMGAVVDYAADGMSGLHRATKGVFDVIVLDIMLPGIEGYELCQLLRHEHALNTPIIMMTARDQLQDKLLGFEAGADDYVVKPFDMPELTARIRALHNRSSGGMVRECLELDELVLDTATHTATRNGQTLPVSPAGYTILELLIRRAPAVVTRAEIEHLLWGEEPPDSDSLRSQIYKLRKAIDKPFDYPLLQTVQGIGFRLAREDAADHP